MHITLVDDSVAFDGLSPATRPLGGAERAFAALAEALARRGHTVEAFNASPYGLAVAGVRWEPLGGRRPSRTDWLIAYRKPELLDFVRHAGQRVLWNTAPARRLNRPDLRAALDRYAPFLLLIAEAQAGFDRHGLTAALLPMAASEPYRAVVAPEPAAAPYAVVTTHPAHGLDTLLTLWRERIRPAVPGAELVLCSTLLARAEAGGAIDPALHAVAGQALEARGDGVRIVRPMGDVGMAALYAGASVHLYPGHPDDMGAYTLIDSQASGCPAVARTVGAVPERIANGVSGYLVPDDESFANLAILLLSHADSRALLGAEARGRFRRLDWDNAAGALEGWLA